MEDEPADAVEGGLLWAYTDVRDCQMNDVFPTTHATWLRARLGSGSEGRDEATRLLFARYREPLRVYLAGTGFSRASDAAATGLSESEDIVHGFLVTRVARPEFLDGWAASGFRLRRWMINAFLFYVREHARSARRRRAREESALGASVGAVEDPLREFDREWAIEVIREAAEATESELFARGRGRQWELFVGHFVDGKPYGELVGPFGVTPSQAASLARDVAFLLRANLRRVLSADGVDEGEVGSELALIEELLKPSKRGGR